MFEDQGIADTAPPEGGAAPAAPERAMAGPVAARLAEALEDGSVVMIAASEARAEAIAGALRTLAPEAEVILFPAPDAIPGDVSLSSPAVAGRRTAALRRLGARGDRRVALVASVEAAAQPVAPPEAYAGTPRAIREGEAIDAEALGAELEALGYHHDDRIDEPGEVAVRGGVIELFPPAHAEPVRIEHHDGWVTSIRAYDPLTQRSDHAEQGVEIEPIAEPPVGADAVSLFAHLADSAIAIDPGSDERRRSLRALFEDARRLSETPSRVHLPLDDAGWTAALRGRARVDVAAAGERPCRRFAEVRRPDRAAREAIAAARAEGRRAVVAGSARDLRFLTRRLPAEETPVAIARWAEVAIAAPGALLALEAEFDRGWDDATRGVLVVAAADVLGSRALRGRGIAADPLTGAAVTFHLGDAVIHEDHGLGVLRGVEPVAGAGDAVRLEYAGSAVRLVPVEEAGKLWRYGADAEAVTLDKLDGSSWAKRRAAIDAAVAETARGLTALAAERAGKRAPVLEAPAADYERFVSRFPYTETADQLTATEAVRADLASGRPMDRLLIGDVGYGKTEVALRAAAFAALAGAQVAVVAPTTVLVRQHLETFCRRFEGFGVEVAGLSRLASPTEAKRVKAGLADGSIRVVVGTSAVAGKGVAFADLGLVVIDEEQRFGAADKAKLRGLAPDGHVLTLSATPIPRTLEAALVGLQDMSVLATPPARRQPVATRVGAWDDAAVRAALLRERARGGQSFVVVPRIEDMGEMGERLRRIVPELRIAQAHGKLPVAEIDEVMVRFADGPAAGGDLLLATNIIEAGLDVPRANTMIVHRADRFGLSQLHQLRGRVGRGRLRGQLLLTTELGQDLAAATRKRLDTLAALDQLGAGFQVAAQDLDLRGAGDLLGEEQAGHMKLIGVGLYQELLGRAIRAARGEAVDDWTPELHLGTTPRLPDDWIPEPEVRINLYARLARLGSAEEVDALGDELEDRFGTVPDEARLLLSAVRLRQLAREHGVARVDAGPAAIAFTPRDGKAAAPAGLEAKNGRWLLKRQTDGEEERVRLAAEVLEALS